jgi:6-phosphogluconolactonase (cycloisomerase 2 family)
VHSYFLQKELEPEFEFCADNRLYTLHELDSTLTFQTIPALNETSSPILSSVSIIPLPRPVGSEYAAAEILIPPTTKAFPNRLIYVCNRNVGTPTAEGDSIAIYEHIRSKGGKETLNLVRQVFTGIQQPRGMEFHPAGKGEEYLAVGGFAGNGGVAIFKRVEGGRNLVEVARNTEIPTRTSFIWL